MQVSRNLTFLACRKPKLFVSAVKVLMVYECPSPFFQCRSGTNAE